MILIASQSCELKPQSTCGKYVIVLRVVHMYKCYIKALKAPTDPLVQSLLKGDSQRVKPVGARAAALSAPGPAIICHMCVRATRHTVTDSLAATIAETPHY